MKKRSIRLPSDDSHYGSWTIKLKALFGRVVVKHTQAGLWAYRCLQNKRSIPTRMLRFLTPFPPKTNADEVEFRVDRRANCTPDYVQWGRRFICNFEFREHKGEADVMILHYSGVFSQTLASTLCHGFAKCAPRAKRNTKILAGVETEENYEHRNAQETISHHMLWFGTLV